MASGTLIQDSKPSQLITINNGIKYQKSGNVVTIFFKGRMSLNTDGYITNNGTVYYLPIGARPSEEVYLFCTVGGYSTNIPYLVAILTNGTIHVYTRDDNIEYLYGTMSFIVG